MLATDLREYREAAFWALAYHLPENSMPAGLPEYIRRNGLRREGAIRELNEFGLSLDFTLSACRKRHQNDIGPVEVQPNYFAHVVDSWPALEELAFHLRTESLIGIDSEWVPLFKSTNEQ